ncbi:MAG TPA: hypothetical protein PKA37_02650, partial [Planctomycetota bacterium]|nr:hypothetical protein [Planctomycetota bacterium]
VSSESPLDSNFEGELLVRRPDEDLDPLPAWELALDDVLQTRVMVLLDGPPAGLLSRSTDVILVCDPLQEGALRALAEAELDVIEALVLSPDTRVLGVLMTRTDRDLALFEDALVEVESNLPFEVFPFSVPDKKSLSSGDPRVVLSDPASRQARGYIELSMEILSHE